MKKSRSYVLGVRVKKKPRFESVTAVSSPERLTLTTSRKKDFSEEKK